MRTSKKPCNSCGKRHIRSHRNSSRAKRLKNARTGTARLRRALPAVRFDTKLSAAIQGSGRRIIEPGSSIVTPGADKHPAKKGWLPRIFSR